MKKILTILLCLSCITATAQLSNNQLKQVNGLVKTAVDNNSKTDQAFTIQQVVAAIAAFNKRQDSLVLAFNAYKLQQEKVNATIPKTITILPGRGIQFNAAGKDSIRFTPQAYYDATTKTFKPNY